MWSDGLVDDRFDDDDVTLERFKAVGVLIDGEDDDAGVA